jgi:hypothetical protein
MPNNLHISYDLYNPGQNYDNLIAKIKTLGEWAKVHKSFWYVNSTLRASEARDRLVPLIDANDTLYIVDSTNNEAAWHNVDDEVAKFIRQRWSR